MSNHIGVRAEYNKQMSQAKKIGGWVGALLLTGGLGLPLLEHFTGIRTDSKIILALLASGLILIGAPVKDLIKAWKAS